MNLRANRDGFGLDGVYSLQVMLGRVVRNGARIGACGTCMDARASADTELIEGIHKSTMAELIAWPGGPTRWSCFEETAGQ